MRDKRIPVVVKHTLETLLRDHESTITLALETLREQIADCSIDAHTEWVHSGEDTRDFGERWEAYNQSARKLEQVDATIAAITDACKEMCKPSCPHRDIHGKCLVSEQAPACEMCEGYMTPDEYGFCDICGDCLDGECK